LSLLVVNFSKVFSADEQEYVNFRALRDRIL
jgi:hypothetical protein